MCELVATMVSYKHIRLRFTRAVTLYKEVMFVNTLSNTSRGAEIIPWFNFMLIALKFYLM